MKREISPWVLAAAMIVVLLLIGWWGYNKMEPAPYQRVTGTYNGTIPGGGPAPSTPASNPTH